jgi:hypothetical protein
VISHNTVINNFNGITLLQSPQPEACSPPDTPDQAKLYGPCLVQNVVVENNGVTMSQGATGELQDGANGGANDAIFTSQNNKWLDNHYCVASAVHPADGYMQNWFAWMNSNRSWRAWQSYGLDRGGTFTVGGTCKPS